MFQRPLRVPEFTLPHIGTTLIYPRLPPPPHGGFIPPRPPPPRAGPVVKPYDAITPPSAAVVMLATRGSEGGCTGDLRAQHNAILDL